MPEKNPLWQSNFSSSRNGRRKKNILLLFQSNWRFNLPSNFFHYNKALHLLRMIFHIRVAQSAGGILFHSNLVHSKPKRIICLEILFRLWLGAQQVLQTVVSIAMFTQLATAHSVSSRWHGPLLSATWAFIPNIPGILSTLLGFFWSTSG